MVSQRTVPAVSMMSLPALLIKAESVAVVLGAIALYANQGGNWLIFVLLLFTPDLSMLGYLANPRIGSYIYNAVHTYTAPALLIAVSLATGFGPGVQVALIWFAHIGIDRTLGFGLKYPTAFKDTHLQRL